MSAAARLSLIVSGIGLALAALVHVAALVAGADWVAFLGAPPSIVDSVREGSWPGPAITLAIAAVLAVFALYAFSAAGRLGPLPLARWVLGIVATLFILRGLAIVPQLFQANFAAGFDLFHLAASAVVLVLGLLLGSAVTALRPAN